MTEPTIDELKELLKTCYNRIVGERKYNRKTVEVDPAGCTYEYTELEWSIRIREILGYIDEPYV